MKTAYLLTNQNNFSHIAYPSSSHPAATVKSGGCGPCAALMVVENLTANRYLMANWIKWVLSVGARSAGGTAMDVLGKAMAKKFALAYQTTDDPDVLMDHLKAGGMAVAHVAGAYGDWKGLFSTAGHFVTVLGLDSDGDVIVGDPDFRSGKFATGSLGEWRARYVEVEDQLVYVKKEYLQQDTLNREPHYYLFSQLNQGGSGEVAEERDRYLTLADVPSWGAPTVEKLLTKGFLKGVDADQLDLSRDMLRLLVIHDRAGLYADDGA